MKKFTVRVELRPDAYCDGHDYFIQAGIFSPDGEQLTQWVQFDSLRSVRSYYNGIISAWCYAGLTSVHLPLLSTDADEYEVPVNPAYAFAYPEA